MRRYLRGLLEGVYGIYAWLVVIAVTSLATLLVAVTPKLPWRRKIARASARSIFALIGVPLQVRELQRLPQGACVVVANHSSYIDGIILQAALPPSFGFVIKREVTRVPLLHTLLKRIGSQFVERFNRHQGATDARRLLRSAALGEALAFFPEGTFQREPGLMRFHSGAFVTAARSDIPVVPVVIKGSREILPARARWPRSGGRLTITVLGPISPCGSDGTAIRALRRATRRSMLTELGEPDLSQAHRELP